MQKIVLISLLVIMASGCSVLRKEKINDFSKSYDLVGGSMDIERVKKQNLSSKSFFIQKAEVEISNSEGKEEVLGSLKFESPDKYLLSIKSKAGLEFSRIFISHDTIMINDKINRKMYCGSTLFLKNKYGITLEILPLLFGDLIEETGNDNNQSKCIDGKITMLGILSGMKNSLIIDCKKGKIVLIKTENDISERDIEIKYNNFMMSGGIKIPGMIEIENFQDKTIVKIRIKKVEFPWDGKIEFIPGNRYEILRLQ